MTQPETASPEPSKQLAISLIRNARKGPDMDAGQFFDDVNAWNKIRPLEDPSEETTLRYLRAVVADEVRRKVLEPAFQERVSEEGYLQLGRLLGLTPPEPVEDAEPDLVSAAPGSSEPVAGTEPLGAAVDARSAQDAAVRETGLTDPNMMRGTGIPPGTFDYTVGLPVAVLQPNEAREEETRVIDVEVKDLFEMDNHMGNFGSVSYPYTLKNIDSVWKLKWRRSRITPEEMASLIEEDPLFIFKVPPNIWDEFPSFYSEINPIITKTLKALTMEQVEEYLKQDPLNLLTFKFVYTFGHFGKECSPDVNRLFYTTARAITPGMIEAKALQNPLFFLGIDSQSSINSHHSPINPEGREAVQNAINALRPDQVREYIKANPLSIFKMDGYLYQYLTKEIRDVINAEKEKIHLNLEYDSIPTSDREALPPEIDGDPELTRIYTGILQEEGGAEMGEKFLKAVRFMMSNVPGLDFKTAALRLINREFREPNG